MNNFFKILIVLSFLTQIYSSAKIVNQEKFDQLLKDNNCKGVIYKDCLDFLDEILSFKNNFPPNHLQQEKIYINEAPQKHNKFKHTYTISKNGINYFLPLYILESNLSNTNKINKEHTISVGDEILVYHLFNKVFFAEIINTHVEEIKPTYLERTNNQPKIIERTNNQQELIEIDYSGPIVNSKGGYDIRLTEKDFELVKQALQISKKYKDLLSFVKILENLNNKNKCDFFLNIEYEKTNNVIILKNLQIKEISPKNFNKHFRLSKLYDSDKRLHIDRITKEKNRTWPKDKIIGDEELWEKVQSDANNKKILKILTFCLNLNSVYSGNKKYIIKEKANASINFYGHDHIVIQNNKLWVLKLFEGKGVRL